MNPEIPKNFEDANPQKEEIKFYDSENFYERLGIDKDASPEDLKKAFRESAKATHPDSGGNAEAFRLVKEAFDVLGNSKKRRKYDAGLQKGHVNEGAKAEYDPFYENYEALFKEHPSEKGNPVIKAGMMVDEARIKLERGELVPNIDDFELLKRTIERYKKTDDYFRFNIRRS